MSAESTIGDATSHRGAWWSFGFGFLCMLLAVVGFVSLFKGLPVLGLIACVSLAFAGVAALFFGIRSLLQMRYRHVTKSTKVAAIFGAVSGGFLGVMLGGMFSFLGLIILIISLTTETATGPEECVAFVDKLIQINFPEQSGIQPFSARSSPLVFGTFDFRDHEKVFDSNIWIKLSWFPKWTTANRGQFLAMMEQENFDRFKRANLSVQARDSINWKIAEQDLAVTKIKRLHSVEKDGQVKNSEYLQYYLLVDVNEKTYGITLIHRPATSGLAEDDIRGIFESFSPKLKKISR